jgi:hypothetical protein
MNKDNLISNYRLNGVLDDYSRKFDPAVITGTASFSKWQNGKNALQFNQSYATINSHFDPNNCSITCKFNHPYDTTETDLLPLFQKSSLNINQPTLLLAIKHGSGINKHLQFSGWKDGVEYGIKSMSGLANVNDGMDHIVSATFDGTSWNIYLDGSLYATAIDAVSLDMSNNGCMIGAQSVNANFVGLIGEVSIHEDALGLNEIQDIRKELNITIIESPKITRYVEFDGVRDNIVVDNPSNFNFGSDGFVLEGWFNPALDTSNRQLLQGQYATTTNQRSWILYRESKAFRLFTSSDGSGNTKTVATSVLAPVPKNIWSKYSVVKYGSTTAFIVDGKVIRKSDDSQLDATIHNSTDNYRIGLQYSNLNPYTGKLKNVSVSRYNKDSIDLYILFGQSNAQGLGVGGRISPLGDIQHHSYTCDCTQASVPVRTNEYLTDYDVYNGSEISFGSLVTAGSEGKKRIAIVKVAENGAGVAGQYGNTTTKGWLKSRNHMYPRLITSYNNAKAALESEGYVVNLRGMWAIVGEDDCDYEDRANNFANNVIQLISDLRTDLGADVPVAWCRKHATLPRPYVNIVRSHEDTLSSLISDFSVIDTDTFGLQGDLTHFNASGQDNIAAQAYNILKPTLSQYDVDLISFHSLDENSLTTIDIANNNTGTLSSASRNPAMMLKAEPLMLTPSLVFATINGITDLSGKNTITTSNAIVGNGIVLTTGTVTWQTLTPTSYVYVWEDSDGIINHYGYNGTVFTNGVAGGTQPITVGATGISSATGKLHSIKIYNEAKSAEWIKQDYLNAVKYW